MVEITKKRDYAGGDYRSPEYPLMEPEGEKEVPPRSSGRFLSRIDSDIEEIDRELRAAKLFREERNRGRNSREASARKGFAKSLGGGDRYKERVYIKRSGADPVDISPRNDSPYSDIKLWRMRREYKKGGREPYSVVYVSSGTPGTKKRTLKLPDPFIMQDFLADNKRKSIVLAEVSPKTGSLEGYLIVRKTKRTPDFGKSPVSSFLRTLKSAVFKGGRNLELEGKLYTSFRPSVSEFREVCEHFNLDYKFVRAKDVKGRSDRNEGVGGLERVGSEDYHPGQESGIVDLENTSGIAAVLLLAGSLLFTTGVLSGSVINLMPKNEANYLGVSLFLIGLLMAIIKVKTKKKI